MSPSGRIRCLVDASLVSPKSVEAGMRIELLAMLVDPAPIEPGETGTVVGVSRHGVGRDAWNQVEVEWDNGSGRTLIAPPDRFKIIGETPRGFFHD
jgi:hypothetical protein